MTKEYDLVVLGGGTGGYVAAIRASQLGMKVALVEKKSVGGTCLHSGCIPSKVLLKSAEAYRNVKEIAEFGVDVQTVSLNFNNVQNRKNKVVRQLHNGVTQLLKKANIDIYTGYGRILGPSIFSPMSGTISIEYGDGRENTMIVPKHVLIATGSKPRQLTEFEIDGEYILDSADALNLKELPASVIIVGAGVIGIEWASMLCDFGVEVTVIESSSDILIHEDYEIRREAERLLEKRGVTFFKEAAIDVNSLTIENSLSINVMMDNEPTTLQAEKLIVAIGREANINNLGLENTNIVTEDGLIQTNEMYQTKEKHIYAIGDCIGGMQLAHVASKEGVIAVEHMANKDPFPLNSLNIPSCVYAYPEISRIGLTEQKAKEKGFNFKVGKFPFRGIGKALVNGETDGFVKIISDQDSGDILGIHMIGSNVTELISEGSLAKVLDATPWEISHTVHPHPALSEVFVEAALAVKGEQIHG